MQFSKLSIVVLSAILSTAAAIPASVTTSVEIPSPTTNFGVEFRDVAIHCPNGTLQNNFRQCFDGNAAKNCNPPGAGPIRQMCMRFWEITCAKRNGCPVEFK
ncbi:hypothetical protein F4805DRAFT_463702 [Annulohypoxylon moriforme]|nr:hypothetical protein F4805DRAFT_463702 [Annulohypoxylon moriforme]